LIIYEVKVSWQLSQTQ